jgi:hypothetical protein
MGKVEGDARQGVGESRSAARFPHQGRKRQKLAGRSGPEGTVEIFSSCMRGPKHAIVGSLDWSVYKWLFESAPREAPRKNL